MTRGKKTKHTIPIRDINHTVLERCKNTTHTDRKKQANRNACRKDDQDADECWGFGVTVWLLAMSKP